MKYTSFKIIAFAFTLFITGGLLKPTLVNAECVETGAGFPSVITSFTVSLSNPTTLAASGTYNKGGECINGIMYREGIPSITISGTGITVGRAGGNIDISSLPNGAYTAIFSVEDQWGGATPKSANFSITHDCRDRQCCVDSSGASTGTCTYVPSQPPTGCAYGWADFGPVDPFCAITAAPTATLTLSPLSVPYGGQSTLTWSSTNASSCTAYGPWSNSGTLSGSGQTGFIYSNTTFQFQCSGPGGLSPMQSVTVNAGASAGVSCNLSATNGCSYVSTCVGTTQGQPETVDVLLDDGTGVHAGNGWKIQTIVGGGTLNPGESSTISCECSSNSGSAVRTVPVSCPAINAPTAALSVTPNPVAFGARPTLTWSSSNATSCTAGGPWSNSGNLSGSGWTDPLFADTTFTYQCSGPGGTSSLQSVTVSVQPPAAVPVVTIAASSPVPAGSPTTITWWTMNADSCVASGGSAGWPANGGATAGSWATSALAAGSYTYTLTCSGPGGSAFASADVFAISPAPVVVVSANPLAPPINTTTNITWSASDATSCSAVGGWTAKTGISDFQTVGPLSAGQHTYTMNCSGPGGNGSGSVTVNVSACGNNFCDAPGETPLNCPTDCKTKVKQF